MSGDTNTRKCEDCGCDPRAWVNTSTGLRCFDAYACARRQRDASPGSTVERDAEILRAFVRKVAPGGCKVASIGAACPCPLCAVDRLESAPSEEPTPTCNSRNPWRPHSRCTLAALHDGRCEARVDDADYAWSKPGTPPSAPRAVTAGTPDADGDIPMEHLTRLLVCLPTWAPIPEVDRLEDRAKFAITWFGDAKAMLAVEIHDSGRIVWAGELGTGSTPNVAAALGPIVGELTAMFRDAARLRSPGDTPEADTKRWGEVERRHLTIHCNYIGGEQGWTVTEDRFDDPFDQCWHGGTPRAAVDASMRTNGLPSPRATLPTDRRVKALLMYARHLSFCEIARNVQHGVCTCGLNVAAALPSDSSPETKTDG